MRLTLITFLFFQYSILHLAAQDCNTPPGWTITKVENPVFDKQRAMFFASETVGYTTGVKGTMRKTVDGGKTWQDLHERGGMGTRANLMTVYFVDEQVGFASGYGEFNIVEGTGNDAEFLRTQDGGLTWEKKIIDSIDHVYDIIFFDALHGLARCVANNGSFPIMQTFDAGDTWSYLESKLYKTEGDFISAGKRVLVYGRDIDDVLNLVLLEIKQDGTIDFNLSVPAEESSFYFYNEEIGFAKANNIAFKTIDGGVTWTEIEFPETNNWSIVHFADENNGIVANTLYRSESSGGETWQYPNGLEVFSTTDGGLNWDRYESDVLCAIEGELNHSPQHGTIHYKGNDFYGTFSFNALSKVSEPAAELKIFPNPVHDYLYVDDLGSKLMQAEIYNCAGQKLHSAMANQKINTTNLFPGFYILRLLSDNKWISMPFIKQ